MCPAFYTLVLPSTIRSGKLRIPSNFVTRYGGELSTVATLSVHDSSVWAIGLRRTENKIWFHDNWIDFLQRYSIGIGYFLLFKYEGRSSFFVHIFNLAGSEVKFRLPMGSGNQRAYSANSLKIFEEMEDDDSIELLESSHFTGRNNYTPPSLQTLFNASKLNTINWGDGGRALSSPDIPSTRDIGVQFNVTEFKKSTDELELRASVGEKFKKTPRKKRTSGPSADGQDHFDENEVEAEMRNRNYKSASARKRNVSAEERERVVNAAKKFESMHPFCRVVLRASYLYRGCIMYLPSSFTEKHLNVVPEFIKIQVSDGRSWSCKCLYKGGTVKLSQGWFEFVEDNNLGEGDVCVFELLRANEVVLHATIFRIIEDDMGFLSPPLLQNQNVSPTRMFNPYMQHRPSSNRMIRS